MSTILVVDDKELLRDSIGVTLQRAGYTVVSATDGNAALESISRKRPDAVVTDLKMPGLTGIELIERVRASDEDLPIVLMTAYGTVESAVQAMKLGATDYILKPFEGDQLVISVKRALEHARLKRDNAVLRLAAARAEGAGATGADGAGGLRGLDRIIGRSRAIMEIKDRLTAISASHATVLISGESGTGKEVVARAIHEAGPRAGEPFLAMNCAAMSESLLESELFGHERGSFTGAEKTRKGRFELAHHGTLLLDEVSEVQPHIQAKLLRVLQEQAFERVGSSTTIDVDVRVLATTNRDLQREASSGAFRRDLYFRLNVLPVHVPPLRERGEDISLLAEHFVARACARAGRGAKVWSREALDHLQAYPWPGNVRELQNICERAVVLCPQERIGGDLIGPWLHAGAPAVGGNGVISRAHSLLPAMALEAMPMPVIRSASAPVVSGEPKPLSDIEREVIVETLQRFNGHRVKTAQALGIGVRTLGLKLKKWKEMHLVADSL